MPLVFVENEQTAGGLYDHWQDTTGNLYHFPNSYRSKVKQDEWFVYYRGIRKAKGRRPHPEYFGAGQVDQVWRDPTIADDAPRRTWNWFCSIKNFVFFPEPVSWKRDGITIEKIPDNHWGYMRTLPQEAFDEILWLAGLSDAWNDKELPTFRPKVAQSQKDRGGTPGLADDIDEPQSAARVLSSTYRILRDTPLARGLKDLHGHECQICGTAVVFPDGRKYSEAHHIKPLGRPHNGPDVASNILVLCPTHHVLCDYRAIKLDLKVIRQHPNHVIRREFLRYHNSRIIKSA